MKQNVGVLGGRMMVVAGGRRTGVVVWPPVVGDRRGRVEGLRQATLTYTGMKYKYLYFGGLGGAYLTCLLDRGIGLTI